MSDWHAQWGADHRFLKICGLRTLAEARAATAAGATALGVLVGLTHRAEDQITRADAQRITQALPTTALHAMPVASSVAGSAKRHNPAAHPTPTARRPAAEPVLVTHLPDPAAVAAMAREIGVITIQVHGDVSPDGMRALRRLAPGHRLIKAVHVTGPDALARATIFAPLADALLLDSRTVDRLGGTGRTHDWTISRRIVAAIAPVPVILAGGLTPDNVAAAIAEVRPAGVDVNSGVEDAAGAKDPIRMRAFISAASAALRL